MKTIIKFIAVLFITAVVFTSCKKETIVAPPVTPPISNNKPPVAKAGPDQTITLPNNAIIEGTGSSDPDGSIASYLWSQISGPNQSVIINSSKVSSVVDNLIQGTYQLELKVTDNGGLFAKDTVQIFVNSYSCSSITDSIYITNGNVRMIPFAQLSLSRINLVSAAAGNKIVFAGGSKCDGNRWTGSTRVDIFDIVTQTRTTAELSQNNGEQLIAVSVANKILIAHQGSTRVDIYDASSNSWTTAALSIARDQMGSGSVGNKAFFAGGSGGINNPPISRIDIYDASTNSWSTAELSEGREAIAATTVGDKLFFAGGYTNGDWFGGLETSRRVDVYNNSTNTWSTDSLTEERGAIGATTLNNKVFFAGGLNDLGARKRVDIYNNDLQSWSTATLSQARYRIQSATLGNRILFDNGVILYGDDVTRFDIYDASSNTWTTADLNLPLSGSTLIRAGNNVYVAGGYVKNKGSDKVWKLEF